MKRYCVCFLLALLAVTASAYVGETFEVGYLTYKVIGEPPSKPAQLAVTGLNATGKATPNLVLNFRSTIGHGDYTYTVTKVAEKAFEERKNIVSVEFNDGMEEIGDRAFYNCSNLSNITFNRNSSSSILGYAFFGTAITTLHLPASLTYFNNTCVDKCINLTSITVEEADSNFSSYKEVLYNKEQTQLIKCPAAITGDMLEKDFPLTLVEIWPSAFENSRLKRLYLPYGVTTLHKEAFAYTYFDELKIPSSVTDIAHKTFNFCAAKDLYMAPLTAPTVQSDEFFGVAVLGNLHVPPGRKTFNYNTAPVWKDFANIYEDAFDFSGYALFSSKDAQGKDIYFGECRFCVIVKKQYGTPDVTLSHISNVNMPGTLTLPDYVTDPRTGEKYIVKRIGCDVCRDGMNADFELVMGKYIKEVEDYAFKDITQLKKVTFSPALQIVGHSSFENCRISNDVILPYGFYVLGDKAFYNNSFKRILLPSSLDSAVPGLIAKNNYLEEIIINNSNLVKYSDYHPYDFTNIPSSCKVYVPVGCLDMFKNSEWGKFNVMEGAFDFVTGSNITGNRYKMTVTSDKPVTVDGVTYDGTAKYVYHPDVLLGSGAYVATDVETNTFNGKKYLMTEFGDSVLCGATGITSVTTSRMKHLERIGNYAFKGSGIKEFTIPSSIKNIGLKAFVGCKNLSELFITQPTNNYSWAGHFYGDNASDFTCYVKWTSLPDWQKSVTNWTRYNNVNPLDQLNGYVQLSNDNKAAAIAVNHPVDWTASGVNAYVVSKYDPATQTVTTATAGKSSANRGVLVSDFTKDQIYKLKRPTGTIYNKTNLLVGAGDAAVNVYQQPGGYLFDGAKKYFWKPTGTYNLSRGYAYLKLDEAVAGSTSRVYVDLWPYTPGYKTGDVDGNGEVDVTDANILNNIILGKDSAGNYGGRADVDGNGVVDVSDANMVTNIILGK